MEGSQDWDRPGMGEPAFSGEPEALVGPRIGVVLVWVGPGQASAHFFGKGGAVALL